MSGLNLFLFNLIHQFAGQSRFLDGAGIFLANWLPYFLALSALVFIWRLRGHRQRIFALVEIGLAVILSRGILTEIIRYFYVHPRPFAALGFSPLIPESGNSFPSGHMTALFAFAIVIYMLNRRWGWWYLALSFAVGLGRIYVGVHWPWDILGGMVIGILCGLLVHWLVRKHWLELETAAAEVAGTAS